METSVTYFHLAELIANAYIIAAVLIVISFVWMSADAALAAGMGQDLAAFSLTLVGIGFWWVANHYKYKKSKDMMKRIHEPHKTPENGHDTHIAH